jgi:hypothetical protein
MVSFKDKDVCFCMSIVGKINAKFRVSSDTELKFHTRCTGRFFVAETLRKDNLSVCFHINSRG